MFIRRHSGRFIFVFLLIIGSFLYFLFHLLAIQFFRSDFLSRKAEQQHNHTVRIEPQRGIIYDRNSRPLALNLTVYSLYLNPRQMSSEAKSRALKDLPPLLGLKPSFLKERMGRNKYFVWIKRKLEFETMQAVKELNIPGLGFLKETRRHYPNNELASHLLGFVGVDNNGLEGLELQFDRYLKGHEGWARILRDARQRDLLMDTGFIPAKDGFDLVLTIDETIQFMAEQVLDEAFKKHHAESATIILMNPKTGEILALANRPTYNLNDVFGSDVSSRTNRGIAHTYEPGSVFKIVAASAALEEEIFSENDIIFCENGSYKVGNHILHDHHGQGNLTFAGVIEQSSNIGTTKIAQRMGAETFYQYAKRFRFGELTGIDLRGEVGGSLKDPSRWSKTTIGAMPIGHEVAVTPLQMLGAISAIANDGVYMKPFVVKYIKDNHDELIKVFEPEALDRIMSPSTARRVSSILTGAVECGTGKRAQIKGVLVAGKTGTAQKIVNGKYSHNKYFASFIGFAPADDPVIAGVVMFDEPHPAYYGGTVAAPVFQEVVMNALKYLKASEVIF
ncbi:MAG: penicillin-binding protein 2 [Candidatus Omnitrophota bacterium]